MIDNYTGIDSGFNISGTWVNKNTGKKIIVRDSFIGETGMVIMTNTGETIDVNDFSSNYIQASDDIYDNNGAKIGRKEVDVSEIVEDTNYKNDLFAPFNEENPSKKNVINEQINEIKNKKEKEPDNLSLKFDNILEKFFCKLEKHPEVNLEFDWTDFPKKELETLILYLDITKEDIANFIYKRYFNKEKILKSIKKELESNL